MSVETKNILDILDMRGEDFLANVLASFSCNVNMEIEKFLKERAIDFAKRRLSITYLVTDTSDGEIVGYFTLTHKAIVVDKNDFSRTAQKKLARYSRLDRQTSVFPKRITRSTFSS